MKLLTSDLMMPYETGDRCSCKITRVQQIYVPELILRLQVMLYASRKHVLKNLKRALEFDNIADSKYKLYDDFSHLDVPPLATQLVLEAYLQVLEAAGQRELIAMYAGALGDNAVERYAMFLTSLELTADINERRLALTRAREHGLNESQMELANIVADSRYKLYDDFLQLDRREYLDAVRRATIAGLEGGGSDPFKIILS
ncbi:hypothetical protein F4604DRAFT_1922554 [Suillus subluteus]|nr:hypothetical protein F4604DRAFT_1922554 [Suillus subluteus]